jgi:positive regulator of sigma E activity
MLELSNSIGAKQGQAVIVGLPEQLFLWLSLRFYLLPLLAALAGAAIGHYLSWRLDASPGWKDAVALTGAVLGGGLAFHWTRTRAPEFSAAPIVHLLRAVGSDGTESK